MRFATQFISINRIRIYNNCPDCGGELTYLYSILPYMVAYG